MHVVAASRQSGPSCPSEQMKQSRASLPRLRNVLFVLVQDTKCLCRELMWDS